MLTGRSSAYAPDRSSRLLGQVDGPCGWAQDMCVNYFLYTQHNPLCARSRRSARGSNGPKVHLVRMGLVRVKRFFLNLSSYVLGHDKLGCMYSVTPC